MVTVAVWFIKVLSMYAEIFWKLVALGLESPSPSVGGFTIVIEFTARTASYDLSNSGEYLESTIVQPRLYDCLMVTQITL